MCGISGILYQKKNGSTGNITIEELKKIRKLICIDKLSSEKILNLSWKLKSNSNFLNYCKDIKYKDQILEIIIKLDELIKIKSNKISKINKNKSMLSYLKSVKDLNNLKDSKWFLEIEINRWLFDIENISNTQIKNLEDESIFLYKDIISVIRSIDNKLELRGRDSLGVSIQVSLEDKEKIINLKSYKIKNYPKSSNETIINQNEGIVNFTLKTYNKVGALGENAEVIRNIIKEDRLIHKLIKSKSIRSAIIVAHTRWASVGEVNIENTHPVISRKINKDGNLEWVGSILNGDIYNYKDYLLVDDSVKYEKNCTNDCLAISNTLINKNYKKYKEVRKSIKKFNGSFVIGEFSSENKNNLNIFKQGSQGLYLGFSNDSIMIASDVYGLVEFCEYFYPIDSNESFQLSPANKYNIKKLKYKINSDEKDKIIRFQDLSKTIITTRDIDRKGFNHFLEKEIYDTQDIVEASLNRYVHKTLNQKRVFSYDFMINQKQVPNLIIKNIKNGKINKIIITGMGTCYTAGVAISNFMREMLHKTRPNILIETNVASEGSGFYLEQDMSDTLVIVIAQSGTTIDTNVYVKKAKDRGAYSLAIANKREGDITFIVDGTLYIGEGRDIEISVPSTKTYTAQVIVGYILSLYIFKSISKKIIIEKNFKKEINKLLNTPKIIQENFDIIEKNKKILTLDRNFLRYQSWFVAYDDSENSVCANEIRIKLSENCYQSIPYLNIKNLIEYKVKDSFITILSDKDINYLVSDIKSIIKNNNYIILLCPSLKNRIPKALISYIKDNKIVNITIPRSEKYYSFLPTILCGQLLSYQLAKIMNSRSYIFEDLKTSIKSKVKNLALKNFKYSYRQGLLNIGINDKDLKFVLNNSNKINNKNILITLDKLIYQSRRTIDTIKHQAKTITVGAVRSENSDSLIYNDNYKFKGNNTEIDSNIYEEILSSFNVKEINNIKLNVKKSKYIYIKANKFDEGHVYNVINLVSYVEKRLSIKNILKLAQPYDIKNIKPSEVLTLTNNNKNINQLNFKNFKLNHKLNKYFHNKDYSNIEIKYNIWTICISVLLIDKFVIGNLDGKEQNIAKEKFSLILKNDLNFLKNSIDKLNLDNNLDNIIKRCAKLIKSSNNIKCLGSGINYNLAKYTSKRIIKTLKRACAFDILENHKHIDISAESTIVVFISNINRPGYQNDALSEIHKIISRNNIPIIITNNSDNRFDEIILPNKSKINVIKIPELSEPFSPYLNIFIINKFIKFLK